MKRVLIIVIAVLGIAACTRVVVLDPAPDSGGGLPDAFHDGGGNDGGHDGGSGFLPDAGVSDAGTLG